jgi:hypothetical protein
VFSRDDSHERDDGDGSLDELLESLAADGDAGDDRPDESADGAEIGTETAPLVESYWEASRTPLTSLVFALPLVRAYEGGVLALGTMLWSWRATKAQIAQPPPGVPPIMDEIERRARDLAHEMLAARQIKP